MAQEKTELNFEFSIQTITRADGKISFHSASLNNGIPYEVIITMMHAWLRAVEDDYFADFKREHSLT